MPYFKALLRLIKALLRLKTPYFKTLLRLKLGRYYALN